jgi:hypothetical protein
MAPIRAPIAKLRFLRCLDRPCTERKNRLAAAPARLRPGLENYELLARTQELKADLGTWRSKPRRRSVAPIPAPNLRFRRSATQVFRSFDQRNACKGGPFMSRVRDDR